MYIQSKFDGALATPNSKLLYIICYMLIRTIFDDRQLFTKQ